MPFLDVTGAYVFLYVLVVIFIRAQYEKYTELRDEACGNSQKDMSRVVLETVLTGLAAGIVCSLGAAALGIRISADATRYLFYIMCFLVLINLRFVCISNAVGLLSLAILIFGIKGMDVPSLLALAGILHLAEGALVFLNAGRDSIPVFINRRDEIAGAYLIRKFWPVPLFLFMYLSQGLTGGAPVDPGAALGGLAAGAYALGADCLVAFLGYSDLAITMEPKKKSRQSALWILGYAAVLLAISLLSAKSQFFMYFGAVFCIGAHEGIRYLGSSREKAGKPIFTAAGRGLRVMDMLPGSPASRMGIRRGDIILNINGKDIQSEESMKEALKDYPNYIWVESVSSEGKQETHELRCYPEGCSSLDVFTVPRERDVTYGISSFEHLSILRNIVSRFRTS